jgi:hypothetical protein
MSSGLTIEGLDELKRELRALPEDLYDDGRDIIDDTAETAAADIRAAYPIGPTGRLAKGVKVKPATHPSPYGHSRTIVNTTFYAEWYERGTGPRKGRGSMKPGNVFVPRMRQHRADMYNRLADLLRSKGLDVTTDG